MNDRSTPHTAPDANSPSAADFARLHRIVEGLIDADLLLPEDGGTLLEVIEAAHRSLDGGAAGASRQHTRRIVLAIEALVQSGTLDEAHGRTALETARRMLNDAAG
jgi:hypothetical protein